jgi:hypothetical protein
MTNEADHRWARKKLRLLLAQLIVRALTARRIP